MPQIKPNHDFLGLIGIEFEEGLRLYGVAPRFWYKRYSPEVQNLEGYYSSNSSTKRKC